MAEGLFGGVAIVLLLCTLRLVVQVESVGHRRYSSASMMVSTVSTRTVFAAASGVVGEAVGSPKLQRTARERMSLPGCSVDLPPLAATDGSLRYRRVTSCEQGT